MLWGPRRPTPPLPLPVCCRGCYPAGRPGGSLTLPVIARPSGPQPIKAAPSHLPARVLEAGSQLVADLSLDARCQSFFVFRQKPADRIKVMLDQHAERP